jgi:hypothetical protein
MDEVMPNTSISQRDRFLKYFGFSYSRGKLFKIESIFFTNVDWLPNRKKNIFYISKTS